MGTISIWLHPPSETPEDREIRLQGMRIRKAFPSIDFNRPKASQLMASTIRLDERKRRRKA
jgi:hypothetical protein